MIWEICQDLDLWQERQSIGVTRPEHAEVTMIQSGQFRFAEAFHDSEHSCIHEANISVVVLCTELAHPGVLLGPQVLDPIRAGLNVLEQAHHHFRVEANVNPVVHFH